MIPVSRDDVKGQWGQVTLGQDSSAEVRWDVSAFREVDAVPAHLGHDVLPEDDNFLREKRN